MIGRIRGILLEKRAPDILVDVQGVGYEVQAPMSTFYQLPAVGAEVSLHTHLLVREDAQLLYAFFDLRERVLFRALIRISGVGPKMALAILSGMAVDDFVRTVRNNDVAAMVRMPGVGKKTAERLIIEMRDRLAQDWDHDDAPSQPGPGEAVSNDNRSATQDAETGLIGLGYKPQQAARMISQVLKDNDTILNSEELIRQALKSMA